MKQMMADLPKERVTPYDPLFPYTGFDFFRPFYVRRGKAQIRSMAASSHSLQEKDDSFVLNTIPGSFKEVCNVL